MGGGGFVAGPGRARRASRLRTPLVLTEADSHLGLANRLLAGRARRVCLAFPIAGREGSATWSPGGRCRRRCSSADRDAARRALRDRRRTRAACWSSAAARARARSTRPRSRRSPSATPGATSTSSTSPAPRLRRSCASALDAAPHASATRCSSTSRTSATCLAACDLVLAPLGRLDLRDRRGRAAGDPRSLPARDRRPPDRQRRLDGARRARRSSIADAELTPSALARARSARCSATRRGWSAMAAASRALAEPDAARADRRRGPRRPRAR